MSALPRLVTYAHDQASIARALNAGADHLVIDDPRLSIRCWIEQTNEPWSRLQRLADAARFIQADVRLSLNIDKLCMDHHLAEVHAAVMAAANAQFHAVRILDGGLTHFIQQLAPQLEIELSTEMGNCCAASVACYRDEGIAHQVLSNDWPAEDILSVLANTSIDAEILVHGPVLLQYSDRRQISAALVHRGDIGCSTDDHSMRADEPQTLPPTTWRCVEVEGRPYPFADNMHGSFMYNTFDRSLFPHAHLLGSLPLRAWLVDGRAQSNDYLTSALIGFDQLRKSLCNGHAEPTAMAEESSEKLWAHMSAAGERSFKPGFFLANNTDYCFEDIADDHADHDTFAHVFDVIRGKHMMLLLQQSLPQDRDSILLHTPEGKTKSVDFSGLCDYNGQPVDNPPTGSVIILPWVKGAVPASTLRRPVKNTPHNV